MQRLLAIALLVALAVVAVSVGAARPSAQASRSPKEIQAIQKQLQKIPIGSDIRVQLVDEQKLEGRLLEVTPGNLRLLPLTGNRLERTIAIDQIKQVQRAKHSSVAKKVAWGVAIGLMAFVGIVVAACAAAA